MNRRNFLKGALLGAIAAITGWKPKEAHAGGYVTDFSMPEPEGFILPSVVGQMRSGLDAVHWAGDMRSWEGTSGPSPLCAFDDAPAMCVGCDATSLNQCDCCDKIGLPNPIAAWGDGWTNTEDDGSDIAGTLTVNENGDGWVYWYSGQWCTEPELRAIAEGDQNDE